MGPRTKQDKQVDRNSNQHESPIYLKNVSNFKASLRRRDSQRFLKREIKEYDLEQKIDVEIRIREGTTKLLAACQHPSQALEAAKTLQTSNERMNVYMSELQSRKRSPNSSAHPSGTTTACSARLGLTDLRFPLMWKDTDHFKNRGDYRRFAVFCLAKVGTEVLDTSLVTPVDRSATDITFPDALVFTGAQPDFQMKLEVYSCMLQDDLSIASTPRKLQKSLHSSISRTLGRKLSATLKDPNSHKAELGPKFDLVATANLSLSEVNDSVKSHDLILENLENPCHQLPLFDHFCCRLAAQPECLDSSSTSEEQTVPLTLSSSSSALFSTKVKSGRSNKEPMVIHAALRGFRLEFWKKKEHREKGKTPLLSLTLGQGAAVVEGAERGQVILNAFDEENFEEKRVEFRCSDTRWVSTLSQRITDSHSWSALVSRNSEAMVIHSPQQNNGSSPGGRWAPRTGSLYEETPLFEEPKSSFRSRPTVHEVFSLRSGLDRDMLAPPPSPPMSINTRSRSSSTSTSSGSLPSWGSVRGLPNFWRFARASIRK